jgi:hypothetical protein
MDFIKHLYLFFIFSLISGCLLSDSAHAQRRQLDPIIKNTPKGGIGYDPEKAILERLEFKTPEKVLEFALNRYQFGDYLKQH